MAAIFDHSFRRGRFSEKFTLALVKPLQKSDKSFTDSISILPQKVLLVQNNTAFKKRKSTISAVFNVLNSVVEALHEEQKILGDFCDLLKVFDCVDRNILLEKLKLK